MNTLTIILITLSIENVSSYFRRHECDPSYCNYNGICIENSNGQQCQCVEQYYSGQHCSAIIDLCQNPISGKCYTPNTIICSEYFGGLNCRCIPNESIIGRFCDTENTFFDDDVQVLSDPMIYLTRQSQPDDFSSYVPNLGEEYNVLMAFENQFQTKAIYLYAAGYLTKHLINVNDMESFDVSPSEGWPEYLTQKLMVKSSRIFRHSGPKVMTMILVAHSNFYERYDFQVYPIASYGECVPIVRVSGGPCSSVNYIGSRLMDDFHYKIKVSATSMCDSKETNPIDLEYFIVEDKPDGLLELTNQFDGTSVIRRTSMPNERIAITVKATENGDSAGFDTCWFDNRPLGRFQIRVPIKVLIYVHEPFEIIANISGYKIGKEKSFTIHWKCTTTVYNLFNAIDEYKLPCLKSFKDTETSTLNLTSWNHDGLFDLSVEVQPTNPNYQFRKKIVVDIKLLATKLNLPKLEIICVHNCGDGNKHSITVVDRSRPIILKVECSRYCNYTRGFMWDIRDLNRNDVESSIMFTTNPLIIPPNYLPNEPSFIVTVKSSGNFGETEYYLCTRSPQLLPHDHLHSICLHHNNERKFTVLIDRIDLCLNIRDEYFPLYFEFYYKVDVVFNLRGVLITHGSSPYIPDVILPTSFLLGVLTIVVASENHAIAEFEQRIEVVSPVPATQSIENRIEFLKNFFYGNNTWWYRMSMEFSIQNNELSEVVQKFYFLLMELYYLPKVPGESYLEEIVAFQGVVYERLYQAASEMNFDTAVDVLQFYSLIYVHILTRDELLTPTFVNKVGNVLKYLYKKFKLFFQQNLANERFQYYRLNQPLIVLLLEGITFISGVRYEINGISESWDYVDSFVEKITKNEMDLERGEDTTFESYSDYKFDNENNDNAEKYKESTKVILECFASIMDLMGLLPEYENIDFDLYNFDHRIKSIDQNWPTGDAFVRMDLKETWLNHTKPIVVERIGEVFIKSLTVPNGEMVGMHLFASETNIFWWNPLKSFTPNYLVLLRFRVMYKLEEPVAYLAHIYYYIPRNIFDFKSHSTMVIKFGMFEELSIHTVVINKDNFGTLVIEINLQTDDSVKVYGFFREVNNLKDLQKNVVFRKTLGLANNGENKVLYHYNKLGITKVLYIAVVPLNFVISVYYQIRTYDFQCLNWQFRDENSWQMIAYRPRINRELYCEINSTEGLLEHYSVFSYTTATREVNFYGYIPLNLRYQMQQCYIIIKSLFLLFVLFGILLGFGILKDINVTKTKKTHYLIDNRKTEKYLYVIIVKTGRCWNAATTSTIGIKLYGDKGSSKRHVLRCIGTSKLFQRCSVEWFALTTRSSLGPIVAVELWIDHRGVAPSWYCDKIYIRECRKRLEWIFVVKKWFSLIYGSKKIHRIIYYTALAEAKTHKSVVNFDLFYFNHLWLGMFTFCEKSPSSLSCSSKVLFAFAQLSIASYFIVIFVNYDGEDVGDYGEIRWSMVVLSAFCASIIASLITLMVSYIFEYSELFTSKIANPKGLPLRLHQKAANINRMMIIILCGMLVLFNIIYVATVSVSFGIRKSYMWLFSLILYLIFSIIIMESLIVMLKSYCIRYSLKRQDVLWFRKVGAKKDIRRELEDVVDVDIRTVLKKDQLVPVPSYLKEELKKREVRFQEFKWITIEVILYGSHLFVLFILFIVHRDAYSYYAANCVEKMVVDASYTYTIPLEEITSTEDIWDYLNYTLLHSTHWRPQGWLINTNFKMVGVIRLRQVRTPFSNCAIPSVFIDKYGSYCYDKLTSDNKDQSNYNPGWKPLRKKSQFSPQERLPFTYSNTSVVKNHEIIGRYSILPAGGYYVFLGRTAHNHRFVLNYLEHYEWLNGGTRILVADFNTYNPNANILIVAQLIIAKKAIGNIHTEFKIYSLKMTANGDIFNTKQFIIYSMFLLATCSICVYQIAIYNLEETSGYFSSTWMYFDFFIVLLGMIVAILIAIRAYYTNEVFKRLFVARNNYYTDFIPLVKAQRTVDIVSGILIFLCTFRMWRFLIGYDIFYLIQFTLIKSLGPIWRITLTMMFIILGFTSIFHLLFGPYYEFANTFDRALILVFSMGFGMAPELRIDILDHVGVLAYIIYAVFYIIFRIFFINLFMSVLIANIASAKNASECRQSTEYTYKEYVIERILGNECYAEIQRMEIQRKVEERI